MLDAVTILSLWRTLCLGVLSVAAVNWIGWAANIDVLTKLMPFWVPMRPWTALWIAALVGALLLQADATHSKRFHIARALALFTAFFSLLVIYEYASGTNLGIDTWWFHDAVERSPLPLPGRPSEQTAIPVLALSLTITLLRIETSWSHALRLCLVAFAAFIPAVAVAAELLRSTGKVHFEESVQIAPATALSLLCISAATVAARPDCPPMSWFMLRPDRASMTRLLVVLLGFPVSVRVTQVVLRELGASAETAEIFAQGFSLVAVGLSVYVVSRQHQQLLVERMALVDSLKSANDRYRLLAENASDLVFSMSTDRRLSWVSPSSLTVLGYEPAELVGQPTSLIVHPPDMAIVDEYRPAIAQSAPTSVRVRLVRKSGELRWCEVRGHAIVSPNGDITGVVAAVRDITDEMLAQQAFEHEVIFDSLTGLPRKEFALQRISEILEEREEPGWALLCVGVNGMTQINQAYTYVAGDFVLRAVAERLVRAVGAHDRVARIAGDEYVVFLPDLASSTGAARSAERLLRAVRGPVRVGDVVLDVTASIGIATADDHDAEELLRDATAAMRQASRKGPDRWEFLDGNVGAQTREALHIQTELRTALAVGQIEAWFMPLVELPSRTISSYETLARWRREDGSVWGPDLFLDIAERSGLIIELDQAMFRQMCAAALRAPAELAFAYNVSAASLSSDSFADWIIDEISIDGIDPKRLKFEITETSIFHVTGGVKHTLGRLADIGIDWWVDDFGTGFSSISHLRDLPVAGLKLDKSFTAGLLAEGSHAAQLAEGLLGLAHGLHLSAIAEGVETAEQEAVLIAQGWTFAQGWLYGKPAPADW